MKLRNIFASLLAICAISSCSSFLDVTPPNSITDEQIKDLMENGSDATKEKIMTAIAAPMIQYLNYINVNGVGSSDPSKHSFQGLEWMRSLMGNDVVLGYNTAKLNPLVGSSLYQFNYDFTTSDADANAANWFGYAYGVNQGNLLLSYMTEEAAKGNNLYKDGRARGLIVRAYSYLCLMENYGLPYLRGGQSGPGMSIYTVYDPGQSPVARSSAKETYDFIIKDLKEASSLIKEAGIGCTAENLEDFDLGVANFLLARAALQVGDYETAKTACEEIIASKAYSFIPEKYYGGRITGDVNHLNADNARDDINVLPQTNAFVDVQINTECILGFTLKSTYRGTNHHVVMANPFSSYAAAGSTARIDQRLYDKIDDNDFRKDAFYPETLGDVLFPGSTETINYVPSYINLKFAATEGLAQDGKSSTGRGKVGDSEVCRFRLSEVYLMLAEAQLGLGNESGAKSTLNTLLAARTRTGAPTLTCDNYSSMKGLSTKEKIQLQWRIEMWGEGGREFFNNKRWGIDVDRTSSPTHISSVKTWSCDKMTLELPQRELEDNPFTEKTFK